MKFCDYGCGQESKFQFANGKWCCSKSRNQCVKEREKNSKSCKGKNKGQLPWNKGKKIGPRSLEDRKKISDNHANVFGSKNPMFGRHHKKESKEKISKKFFERYKNPNFLEKLSNSLRKKPNKPENFLVKVLKHLNYKYTGDYTFWINGKNPDFVNFEKKKIIEYFGSYWHDKEVTGKSRKEHEEERKIHFRKNNYEVLIIWEEDLKDVERLSKRILEFDNV